ncbi:MAG TPA: hypothetical protein VIK71_03725 [Flavobacteriales bacterium]
MQPTLLSNAQLHQMADLMTSLYEIQTRMSRVKNTFPNYYKQLQQSYSQLLLQAKENNIVPPWMRM